MVEQRKIQDWVEYVQTKPYLQRKYIEQTTYIEIRSLSYDQKHDILT